MQSNEIIYALICINNHVLSCLIGMLLVGSGPCTGKGWRALVGVVSSEHEFIGRARARVWAASGCTSVSSRVREGAEK